MTAPIASWKRVNWQLQPSITSRNIVLSMLDDDEKVSLDFGSVEKDLAEKINDDDMRTI